MKTYIIQATKIIAPTIGTTISLFLMLVNLTYRNNVELAETKAFINGFGFGFLSFYMLLQTIANYFDGLATPLWSAIHKYKPNTIERCDAHLAARKVAIIGNIMGLRIDNVLSNLEGYTNYSILKMRLKQGKKVKVL